MQELVGGAFSAGAVMNRTTGLVRLNARPASVALLVLTGLGALGAGGFGDTGGTAELSFLTWLVSVGLLCWVTNAALEAAGNRTSARMRYPAMLGLSLLTTLGILFGLAFLIVPGLILAIRWSVSAPILLGSDAGVIDALRQSWRETRGRFWPIFGVFALLWILVIVAAGLLQLVATALESALLGVLFENLAFYTAIVVGWHVAVAIYARSSRSAALAEVFA